MLREEKLMFEHFTERAIKAVMFAQEEARRTGHNLVGSEHLLLGIIGDGTSFAATVLKNRGITVEETRRIIANTTGRGPGYSPPNIPFTPKVKGIFQQSFQEARQLGDRQITPEHILLAMSKDPDNLGSKALKSQGVNLEDLRTEIIKQAGEQVAANVGGEDQSSVFGFGGGSKPNLEQFSRNLNQEAAAGKLDPVVGRSIEVQRSMQILGRRTKNNPVLVGEPGVGKTAIAEGIAQRIVEGDVPELLKDKQIISLDMGLVLAGTRFRGEFEERIKAIIDQVRQAGNIILVIDELHTLVGAGATGGGLDASNLMKPALARGELQCLGTTTLDEYRKYIEKDAALERRFQKVMVGEPSVEETIEILLGLRKTYEEHHQVKISSKAIEAAAKLSEQYISDRFLPDKAIDLIDEAGSRIHLRHSMQQKKKHEEDTEEKPIINPQSLVPVVDEEAITEIVSAWTGVPLTKLTESESELLVNLEATLHERIIGQDEAVTAVSRAIRRSRAGLKSAERPIASLIFSGPTGVGKTELAKVLAAYIFGSEDAMIRLDMSEFMEAHTISKLIGSPPGYVGYDDGGQLTEAVRRKPYSVLLFDEIEKAHPDVFNLLLQLLDDGRLTDSKGRKVNFNNTLVIMTSNIGSKVIEKGGTGLGFDFDNNQAEAEYNRIRNLVNDELKQYFRPEFLNRLDEIIVFRQLTKPEVNEIADILLKEVSARLEEQREISLEVTEQFRELVVTEGYDPKYGARPLRRAIMRLLEDSLAEAILTGELKNGNKAIVDVNADSQVKVIGVKQPQFEYVG